MIRLCAFADEADKNLAGQIDALKKNSISLIEPRNVNGKNIADLTNDEVAAAKEALDSSGISVWSIGSPLGKADISNNFDEYLKTVRRVCEIAVAFSCDKVRTFSFFKAYEKADEVFARLQKMVDVAKEYGVELYHENEKEVYGDVGKRVREIMGNVKGLKYIYDPANYIQTGENAEDTLPLCRTADYFHIKDVVAQTGELVPAGMGDAKIGSIIDIIGNRDTVLTLEPHLKVFKGYSEIDGSEMKHRFEYRTNTEAFDAAVEALKKILTEKGYREIENGSWSKE